jgi:hypothetical protein
MSRYTAAFVGSDVAVVTLCLFSGSNNSGGRGRNVDHLEARAAAVRLFACKH